MFRELCASPSAKHDSVRNCRGGCFRKWAVDKVVGITLRQLGPVIQLLPSLALVEGGSEVMLQVSEYMLPSKVQTRAFTLHWQNGELVSSKA